MDWVDPGTLAILDQLRASAAHAAQQAEGEDE